MKISCSSGSLSVPWSVVKVLRKARRSQAK